MQSIRLKLHFNYLANFDFVDKNLQTNKDLVVPPKLNALIIRPKLDRIDSEKYIILKAFVLESFANQKTLTTKISKVFSKKLLFKITLRKDNLFLFLDSCLNTLFLQEYKYRFWDNIQVENKLYFYLETGLLNSFNIASIPLKYSLQLSNLPESWSKLDKDLPFYLIPINNNTDK